MLKLVTLSCILVVALCETSLQAIVDQCKSDYGITEDTAKILLETDMTANTKCFFKCLYDKSGYVGGDGKILVDKMKATDAIYGEFKAKEGEIYECLEKLTFKSCEDAVQVNNCFLH